MELRAGDTAELHVSEFRLELVLQDGRKLRVHWVGNVERVVLSVGLRECLNFFVMLQCLPVSFILLLDKFDDVVFRNGDVESGLLTEGELLNSLGRVVLVDENTTSLGYFLGEVTKVKQGVLNELAIVCKNGVKAILKSQDIINRVQAGYFLFLFQGKLGFGSENIIPFLNHSWLFLFQDIDYLNKISTDLSE